MTRYREISSAEMTSAQKEVHDEIVAGRRGRFGGPFQILIRAPEVCRHLQRLGEYLRWGSSLPPALSELAICLTARHLRASYEWHAHAPLAVEAGVPAAAHVAVLNVTVTNPTAPSYLTVWPDGNSRPLASDLNYRAGASVPAFTLAALSGDGKVCVFTYATADVIIDLSGWVEAGTGYVGITPTRLVDTRSP